MGRDSAVRTCCRKPNGYADVVFFEDAAAIDRVTEAERNSDVCAAFFAIMNDEDSPRVYEALKSYE